MGAEDLVSGTWTIPAGEKVPDFSKWEDDLAPVTMKQWRRARRDLRNVRAVPRYVVGKKKVERTAHRTGRVTRTTRLSFGEMRRYGMQEDYVVDISPTRTQSLGLPALSPDKNLILRTQADFNLLSALSIDPDGDEAKSIGTHVEVGGVEVPYVDAQRRILATFGITEASVSDPSSLADDRLHLWVSDLLGRQMILSQRFEGFVVSAKEPSPPTGEFGLQPVGNE
jgi:hypothetical protein